MYGGRLEMREAIMREIEKERIRGVIIAEEIERRRMAMSSEGRFSSAMMRLLLPPGHTNLFEQSRLNQQPIQLEERIIMSINENHNRESSRFHPCEDSLKITEISPPVEDSRKKMISLDKPIGESLCGRKRKSTSPVAECSSAERSKKKVKEWSCAICQVSTTSKHSLNEHLGGKKHKVKVAAGANFGLGVTPIINPLKLALTTANPTKKASTTKMENEKKRGS